MTSAAPPSSDSRRPNSIATVSVRHSKMASSGAARTAGGSSRSKCAIGSGASVKARLPTASISTRRSCQPRSVLTACWIGSASKNSLATIMAGPRGTSLSAPCQNIGTGSCSSVFSCTACSAGLISTRCSTAASRKAGSTLAARSASFIMVPRPGPSSMTRTLPGSPICFHTAAIHSPINSPNIWLISGEVMKSPRSPSGSRVV